MRFESLKEWALNNINEQKEEPILQQGGKNPVYDWFKNKFRSGKVKVEVKMSFHPFEPGYYLEDAPESTKDFPGMYGEDISSKKKSKNK